MRYINNNISINPQANYNNINENIKIIFQSLFAYNKKKKLELKYKNVCVDEIKNIINIYVDKKIFFQMI